MKISFPEDLPEITATDFSLLLVIRNNEALWKMEATRKVNSQRENQEVLEVRESISKQAVSKRINRLFELGYLEREIISFDGEEGPHGRKVISGYAITEKGKEMLNRAVVFILRDALAELITESEEISGSLDRYFNVYNELNESSVSTLPEFAADELDSD